MDRFHQSLRDVHITSQRKRTLTLAGTLWAEHTSASHVLQFWFRTVAWVVASCVPNLGSPISIASCVGSWVLFHLDLILPLVDELTRTFPVPKLPDVVCDEPEKPFGQCASVAFLASLLGSSSPLSSVDEMNVQAARALRPGRRILIRSHGDTSLHERTFLAIIIDQEWFVVEPGGRIRLEHLDGAGEVRLVPTSGGRPTGVTGPIECFSPAPA